MLANVNQVCIVHSEKLGCPAVNICGLSSSLCATQNSSVSAGLQQTVTCSVCLVGLQLDQLEREFGRLGSAGSRSAAVTQLITKEKEVQQSAVKLHSQQEQLGPQVKTFLDMAIHMCFSAGALLCRFWTESTVFLKFRRRMPSLAARSELYRNRSQRLRAC